MEFLNRIELPYGKGVDLKSVRRPLNLHAVRRMDKVLNVFLQANNAFDDRGVMELR